MNLVQITPGAGKMYCGNCFRDNALVAAWRAQGHRVTMIPLYLPLTLEEESQTAATPIFFNGISVYLEQKYRFFRHAPRWLHNLLASPSLLKMAAGSAAKTHPSELGDLTISMLRGEEGNQAAELKQLIHWLKDSERPDVISLSNALLVGMARKLKEELGCPVVCSLQGEDGFLDGLPEPFRERAWQTLTERAGDVDLFVAPSFYFSNLMGRRLRIPEAKLKVIYNGIRLDGFRPRDPASMPSLPTIGYFARMCPQKGLDLLVDAFIRLRQSDARSEAVLKVGGHCGPSDEAFVNHLRRKLEEAGLADAVTFHPNLSREEKQEFLSSLSVFSVPALYGEAFGLYLIEALAAGVPVVQPRHGAFPELIRATGGGLVCDPSAEALATTLAELLGKPARAKALGETGRRNVERLFTAERMASETTQLFRQLLGAREKARSHAVAR